MNIKELLEENPVIAAVKNEEQLDLAVNSSSSNYICFIWRCDEYQKNK